MMAELDILNGFAGKVISECIDITVDAIKKADKNRKSYNQNMQTRIYQVIIDSLNYFTYNKYKRQDKLYDASESILKGFESGKNNADTIESGLKILISDVDGDMCQDFLETLCREICRDDNSDLYKEIDMLWKRQESEYIHREFERNNQNHEATHSKLDYAIKGIDYIKETVNGRENNQKENYRKISIKNRAEEYAQKWYKNVFLNDYNEEDENAGVNIELKDIYIDECLPHYIWKTNTKPSVKLKNLLEKYTIDNNDKKMLLILGQPGIGKSTLITWIMANLVEKKDDILVYQFASDLSNAKWESNNILDDIFKSIGYGYRELEGKTLILDGFDEIHTSKDRKNILNQIYQELLGKIKLKSFSLIITCREKYIYDLPKVECDYVTLQRWNEMQIKSFCRIYGKVSKSNISQDKIDKILENEKIFGVPLILYMVLALGITIEKNSSIVDVYDQIFSMDGGSIYDRCIKTSRYEALPHRIAKIKQQIHLISQRIAFWIFENKPDDAFITKDKYEEICDDIINETSEENEDIKRDVLISNYFEPIKHCEGIGTEELQFVHRSIYEYFVAEYFFESIHKLSSKEEVAGKLGELLKDGHLSEQILEFIKYKFDSMKGYNLSDITKEVFNIMLRDGMTYHIGVSYKNAIERERNIFSNMLQVVGLWNPSLGELDKRIVIYLQCNRGNNLNLSGANLSGVFLSGANLSEARLSRADLFRAELVRAELWRADLSGADIRKADLSGAELRRACLCQASLKRADLSEAYLNGANLWKANLVEANLNGADLSGADLSGADLSGADLSGADLRGAKLIGAKLRETTFDENQVNLFCKKYDLTGSRVCISETEEIISYQEYCLRKQST